MFQPTSSKKKDNNLGLPPKPISLEGLADKQEPPVMGAGGFIVPVSTLINKNLSTDEVPAYYHVQVPNLPVLTANEVPAAPAQAGASMELLVLTVNEVPTPVQAGVGTEFIQRGGGRVLLSISGSDCR
jgi:hypothetical protein